MKPLERFTALKKQVSRMQRETDKAAGALQEITKQLKREFGCSSLEDAEKLLKELQKKERATERRFKFLLRRFEKKHKKVISGHG